MKSYAEVRKDVSARMQTHDEHDPGDALLPCAYCGKSTPRKVLSMRGARCLPCFDLYLSRGYSGKRFEEAQHVA